MKMNKTLANFTLCSLLVLLPGYSSCVSGVTSVEAAQVYFNLANSYRELGREADAVNSYLRAWELDPELFQAGYNLARLNLELGQVKEARQQLEELLSVDRENTIFLEALAWSYSLEGDEEKTVSVLKKVCSLDPANHKATYNLAILLERQEDIESSIEYYWALYQGDGFNEIPLSEGELLMKVAELEFSLGNIDKGMEHLEYLAVSSPTLQLLKMIGDRYLEQLLYAKALDSYEQALELYQPDVSNADEQPNEIEPESAEDASEPSIAQIVGEIQFNRAYILLTVIEDEEAGLEALKASLGKVDEERIESLLEYEGFLFSKEVETLLEDQPTIEVEPVDLNLEETSETEDSLQ